MKCITNLDLESCERIIDAIAVERAQWDKCTRELGERAFANYIRTMNFKRNLAQIERFELVVEEFDFIVAHRSELKLSKIKEWKVVEKLFIEAAVVVARTGAADSGCDHASSSSSGKLPHGDVGESQELPPLIHHVIPGGRGAQSAPTHTEITDAIRKVKTEGKDIEMVCSICTKKAIHTVDEQLVFAGKGWFNTPRKCTTCTEEQNKSRVCFDFASGRNCRKGDLCRFSHSGAHQQKAPEVRHASAEYEDNDSSDEYGDY